MTSPTATTILIVDDEIQNRKLLEALLRHEGYLTLSATNGEEALALIAQRAPDLILLDIVMPGMDGYQVASNLKANPATSNIPIIMVTAEIDRSARLTGLNAGVEEFLTKPVDGAELRLRVRNLLRLKEFGEFLQNHSRILEQQVQALRDSAEKLRLFADNVPAMTVSWDENLRCRFANKAFAEFFGFTVENILGKHLQEVVGEEAYREVEGHFAQALQGHPVTYQRTRKLPNGESRYLESKLLPQIGDQGKVLSCFSVTTDISEHKLVEERIQRVAHHDSLTGLPNRLLFNDRLNYAISLAKRGSHQFALLYLDLDKFKPVNDTRGHAAGDELLQTVAARIRHQVRESDTVARVGGDEFTVILPDIARREDAETVAKKIIAALAAPFQLGSQKQSVDIGASIGIALYPADARDADALVKAADAAMYSAKQAGMTDHIETSATKSVKAGDLAA